MVWLATRLYDAYKKGGVDAVVTELGKQIAIQVAGGAIMKGVIAGARHLLMSPTSKKIFGKMMELIDDTPFAKEALDQGKALAGKALDQGAKLMDKFDQSKLGKFLNSTVCYKKAYLIAQEIGDIDSETRALIGLGSIRYQGYIGTTYFRRINCYFKALRVAQDLHDKKLVPKLI